MSIFYSYAFADSTAPAPGGGAQAPTTTASTVQTPAGAQGVPGQQQPGAMQMMMPFVLMFGVVYFLILRPQQKKMKDHQATLSKIQHGDEIVTNAGIFGKVTGVTDKVLTLEIADGVRVKMLKSQVASVNPDLKTMNEKGA